MKRTTGFTLIELLVVIAIIAVLAAILFPVFASAKRASKKTTALSNISQIGKAMHLYLADYDDRLPFRFPGLPHWDGYNKVLYIIGPGLTLTYAPYLPNEAVWFSPEDKLDPKGFTSFCFNEQLAFDWSMSSIARPAEAIYLTDRSDVAPPAQGPPGRPDTYTWWLFIDRIPFDESQLPGKLDPVSVATEIDPIRYVGDVAAYLYLDGHVLTAPFERTWGDATRNQHLATKP